MLNLFIRCLVLYFFLLLAMRLMGKRQLGELQPFELAITLVASDLVCIPMADATIPLIYGIIPVFSLFLVHIIITKLATKSIRFRKFLNGKPVIIIEKGNILPNVLKDLNMNIDDVMEALRGSGYFNPSEVEYAILETNGSLTVMPKSQNKPVSPEDLGLKLPAAAIPVSVIMEGEFIGENLAQLDGATKERVLTLLDNLNVKQKDVLVLLVSGEDVFLQPYTGNFVTAQLSSDEAAKMSISVHGESSEVSHSQNNIDENANIIAPNGSESAQNNDADTALPCEDKKNMYYSEENTPHTDLPNDSSNEVEK